MTRLILNIKYILIISCLGIFLSSCGDDSLTSEDYAGNYTVSEVCDGVTFLYSLSIADAGENEIRITNLWDWEETMTATIDDDILTLPTQTLDDVEFNGSGTFNNNILTITYIAVDENITENCVATATKN
jgi:hypothetical protein